ARRFYRVEPNHEIVAAPGTQSLIELLPRTLPGRRAALLLTENGTYNEHAHGLEQAGIAVVQTSSIRNATDGFDLAVLVHPNNPDGHFWDRDAVLNLAEKIRIPGGHVIVDEAFCDLAPERSFVTDAPSNMIIYRSFGKFFGLAGLRLGFAICTAEIALQLRKRIGPWPISGPAIEIGKQALNETGWSDKTRNWLEIQSGRLIEVLESAGLQVIGKHRLFVLAKGCNAEVIAAGLAREHILVRSFPDRPDLLRFGLPDSEAGLSRLSCALAGTGLREAS
ncbi:MAG: aminotransferase class I/II-fold pyridoxal phosphate-dependent enzyme, partial [Rhizobiaceae bacterium]